MLILVIGLLLIAAAISYLKFGSIDPSELTAVNIHEGQASFPTYWIPYAILAFIALLLVMWLLGKILSAPKAIKRSNKARNAASSHEALNQGLMQITSGEYEKGEATLTSHLDGDESDASKYISAAKSAESRGAHEQAEHYLKKASDSSNSASYAVRASQAEMLMGRGEYDKAETLLTNLHNSSPENKHVMGLLASTLQHTGNASKLSKLTQIMRKNKAMPEDKIAAYEGPAWSQAIADSSNNDLKNIWDSLPSEARTNPKAVGAYAKRLVEVGDPDQAEAVVHKVLNKDFDESLASMYGDIESSNAAKQLENAERWAQKNTLSSGIMASVGKLAAKRDMWSKARDSLARSAQLDLNPGIANELGEVMESMGDKARSQEFFKNAARLAAGKSPTGLLSDLPNLVSALGSK